MAKRKRRLKKSVSRFFRIILILLLIPVAYLIISKFNLSNKEVETDYAAYISSESTYASLYDVEYNELENIVRGTKVTAYSSKQEKDEVTYTKIKYNDNFYMVKDSDLVTNEDEIIKEKELYVRTSLTVYKDSTSSKILSRIKKGEKVSIIGYDKLDSKGVVNKYKIRYNDIEGYVYGKYLVKTSEEALALYDANGLQDYLDTMGNTLGGGTANKLDYYPYEKPKFKDNVMPDNVRALYINIAAISSIDNYIDFALKNNINAFVIDIKDDTLPAYDSPVMKEYSQTNYDRARNKYEDYKANVKKAKDAGLYVIGRITTFKDSYFVKDHNEVAITSSNGELFKHNGSYWPSAYNRYVWEFNVELAKEAVKEMGFNEIQFDYVRFPDRINRLEAEGAVNFNNKYNEDKAEAIQGFIMYACDEIHALGAYVSVDVFGESASSYVTAYGQFWPAISNVVDVISGMPYPDHFNAHEYGISEVVWTVPYKLLSAWGSTVAYKQSIIPTPAVVRTWIQAYNTTKEPSVVYDATKVSEEIQALYDKGLTGGFMTWNSGSNLNKYREISAAFKKVY